MTLKEIKNIKGVDLTNKKVEELKDLKLTCKGVSYGKYGMNGAYFTDSEGTEYVITKRTSALFYLV